MATIIESEKDDRMKDLSAGLGRAIRAIRTERGWSGIELARRVGISGSYVALLESGRRPPSFPVLLRVAKACGVLPSELLARAEGDIGVVSKRDANDPTGFDAVLRELQELADQMTVADKERLLDLARRLAK